jgi:hypothetical protein
VSMKKSFTLFAVCSCLALTGAPLTGEETLTVKVTPAAALAPAFVRVRATVGLHDDNRALVIIAESDDFYTSSEIPLNGRHAPRVSVVEYPNLPMGFYRVTGILIGPRGQRAIASQRVNVTGSGW